MEYVGTVEDITGETYGPLKALCENAVRDVFDTRALVVRPAALRVLLGRVLALLHEDPDLVARFRQFGSPVPLAAPLWNHAPAMLDRIDKSGIPYPVFQEGEMADLLGFLGAFADVSR